MNNKWVRATILAILTLVLLCMVYGIWSSMTMEYEFSNFFKPVFEGGN